MPPEDGLPPRAGRPLPDGFGPLEPIWGASGRAPARDDSAPRPRSRLTSSALRRNAPDLAVVPATAAPPQPVAPVGPAPDLATSDRAAPRRRTAVAGAVVCAVLAACGAAVVLRSGAQGDSAVAVETTTRAAASASALAPPVDLAPDSEYVETDVLEGGDLRVTHWISTTQPVDRIGLGLPSSPGLAQVDRQVSDVVVAADGVRLDVDLAPDATVTPIAPTDRLYVQYVLPGAVDRTGSAAGRGLATVTSLDVELGIDASLARTQVFPADDVLTLACLARGARAAPELCGTRVAGTWQVESPAGDLPAIVIAQLDLTVVR